MTRPWAARRAALTAAVALAAACALAAATPGTRGAFPLAPAFAGDAKVAETLFKSGKQAFQKGDFEGAITFFKKTLEEEPTYVEAAWWRAASEEKRGDKPAALASYREYLALVGLKSAPSKEELRLKALAEKSVDALGGGEKDLRRIEDAAVQSLFQFAKDNFVRDPGVTLKALAALLHLRPDHAEALKLREKLGGVPAAPEAPAADQSAPGPATGPFRDVKEWKDLLADKALESKAAIRYADGLMTVDTKAGFVIRNESPLDFGAKYAYEMEFKVAETYERGWLTGLLFAYTGSGVFYSAHVMESRVELLQAKGPAQNPVANFDMPALVANTWHRVGVIVEGPAVQVWFDGKKVLTWREPSGQDLTGEIGIFQQRCRTERRVFRAGKVD